MTRTLAALAVLLYAPLAWPADASPEEEKRACFAAVDAAQRDRITHKLVEAKEGFIVCARPVCPVLFRNDCVTWLAEVQSALPSVVLGAKDSAGHDLLDVTVLIDGKKATDRLDGTAIDINPGPHVFRFEWAGHGATETQAVIREGERDRSIAVTLPLTSPPETPRASGSARVPVGVWILGGVAVAGVAGFSGLFLTAASDVHNLRSTCEPNCPSSSVDSDKLKVDLAYTSLGIGIAAAGAGLTWFLVSRSNKPEAAALRVEPSPGGGRASLTLPF